MLVSAPHKLVTYVDTNPLTYSPGPTQGQRNDGNSNPHEEKSLTNERRDSLCMLVL